MSGPKLSAFELEERRKKELERKQRDYYQLERLWGDGEKQDITSLLEAE